MEYIRNIIIAIYAGQEYKVCDLQEKWSRNGVCRRSGFKFKEFSMKFLKIKQVPHFHKVLFNYFFIFDFFSLLLLWDKIYERKRFIFSFTFAFVSNYVDFFLFVFCIFKSAIH